MMDPMQLVELVELAVERGADDENYNERGIGLDPKPLPTDPTNILLEFGNGIRKKSYA